MSEYHCDDFGQQRGVVVNTGPVKSRKPVWTLLLSVLVFIPFAPFIAFCMGLSKCRKSPLAGVAVLFGLLFTVVQAGIGFRGFEHYQQIAGGPGRALTAGYGGDLGSFRAAFDAPVSDDEARAFIETLKSRYGHFHFDQVETLIVGTDFTAPRTYDLMFDKETVRAQAAFTFDTRPGKTWGESRLSYLRVRDPERGDLRVPVVGQPILAAETP